MNKQPEPASVQQTNTVSGDNSGIFSQYARDINQTVYQAKPEFFEPTLEQFKPPKFTSPQLTPDLIKTIRKHNILVLGYSLDIDKADLARHLAWSLREKLQQELNSGDCNIPIKEWQRSSEPQSIHVELQKTETTTIFILNQVSPQNVGYDLFRIQKAATSGQHYVLVSTDTPFASWKLPESAREFWPDLKNEQLYNPDDLVQVIIKELNNNIQKLRDNQESLPLAWSSGNIEQNELIVGNLSLLTVAKGLKNPEKIVGFVQLLLAEKEPLQEAKVLELMKVAETDEQALRQWYYHILDEREQLLALGLSFFDGLFEDQFFAALEKVVKSVWQQRNSSLRALDYCDLDNLGDYFKFFPLKAYGSKLNGFKFVKTKDYATEIEISRIDIQRNEKRRLLFKVTWESHRRQILTALPVIVQLVKDSVAKEPSNWELYGGEIRCNQLRNVLSETLSALGVVSTSATSAVQGALIKLATEREFEVQNVAARAMARWRDPDYDRDQELFGTLQRFYSIAIDKEGYTEEDKKAKDCIAATVALTVSYAALYDPPDVLIEDLHDWIKELSENPSDRVRDYFGYHTLFYVVPLHLTQLRYTLKEITEKHTELNKAIAKSLARAYLDRPQEVLETLELWYKQYPPSKQVSQENITRRERVLAAVALTYGEIQYDEEISAVGSKAFSKLSIIFIEEKHHFVREAATTAICSCISQHFEQQHFEQIEVLLQDLVPNVTEGECSEIIETLTEVYLKQRESLNGGDGFIKVNNHRYRAWIDATKRPETDVEKVMLRWVKNDTKAIAQQVAIRTLLKFAVLEQQEKSLLAKQKQEPDRRTQKQLYTILYTPITIGQLQEYFYFARLVSWLVTLRERDKPYQLALRNVFPEALKQHNLRRETMSFVLRKWRHATDNKIKIISDLLKNGLWLAENFWLLVLVVMGSGILLTFTGMALVNVIQSIPVTTSQPTPDSSVVPTPEPTSNSTFTQQEAVNVINNYLQAKERIFARPYDRQLVASLTTGKYYDYITKPGGPIDELEKNNRYFRYGSRQTEPLGYFSWTGNLAEIEVKITEQAFLYENDSFKKEESYSERYRFTLEQQNGVWKIADREKIGSQDGE